MSARLKVFIFIIGVACFAAMCCGAADPPLTGGQTVYVPVYSHVYGAPKGHELDLTATLSIRNTNRVSPITIDYVEYFDTDGKLLDNYLKEPRRLGPMATIEFQVPERDKSGGSGANFVVKWSADRQVNPPIIETVMISTKSGLGISLISAGRVIKDENRK
jgi:hypothetical protein